MKLLIVDDSALMRRTLREMFEGDADWQVEIARNGVEALERIRVFQPDVVTLDINMPEMDGLTCLAHVMTERPVPVVMISSLTERGALATLEALNLGAVDWIAKPDGTVSLSLGTLRDEIRRKVRAAARARARAAPAQGTGPSRRDPPRPPGDGAEEGLVVVGASTGGPQTLEAILPSLSSDFPLPIVVAQHMPPEFTRALARRLDGVCSLPVSEIQGPTRLDPGTVWIARGGADVVITRRSGRLHGLAVPEDRSLGWHPSVERLVRSAREHLAPPRLIAVQLTGMGSDGAEAMAELRRAGGHTLAESEGSAVVYGMPRALVEAGGAEAVLPREKIADRITGWARRITGERSWV